RASAIFRVVSPMKTTPATRISPDTAAMPSPRRDSTAGVEPDGCWASFDWVGSSDMWFSDRVGRLLVPSMGQAEYDRHEHESCDGSKYQAANNSAPERRVLLAAFAEAERHRRHADDHGERGHQHRAEADEAGLDRGFDRIAELGQPLAGKADHQHAVGGGDAHAHDGAGQRRHHSVVPVAN